MKYTKVAEKAVEFILNQLQKADGRLFHRYRDGEAAIEGNLDDYAYLVWGLIELYETTFKTKYLEEALRLQKETVSHFWDRENGGFYFTSDDSERLLIRNKEFRDGAVPSGNSISLNNLIKLARMTGKIQYEEKAWALARAFSTQKEGTPAQNTMFLTALSFLIGTTYEIVIVGDPNSNEGIEMLQAIRARFSPYKVILFKRENDTNLESLAGFTKDMKAVNSKTAAYICKNFVCHKPVTTTREILVMLNDAL